MDIFELLPLALRRIIVRFAMADYYRAFYATHLRCCICRRDVDYVIGGPCRACGGVDLDVIGEEDFDVAICECDGGVVEYLRCVGCNQPICHDCDDIQPDDDVMCQIGDVCVHARYCADCQPDFTCQLCDSVVCANVRDVMICCGCMGNYIL